MSPLQRSCVWSVGAAAKRGRCAPAECCFSQRSVFTRVFQQTTSYFKSKPKLSQP